MKLKVRRVTLLFWVLKLPVWWVKLLVWQMKLLVWGMMLLIWWVKSLVSSFILLLTLPQYLCPGRGKGMLVIRVTDCFIVYTPGTYALVEENDVGDSRYLLFRHP